MTKKTWLVLFIMALLSFAAIWSRSLRYYPFLLGFAAVVLNGVTGSATIRECGLGFSGFAVMLRHGTHRQLFFLPLVVVSVEILAGRVLFDNFTESALSRIDEYLVFNDVFTLVIFALALVALEEIPWRCYFQWTLARQIPDGWALLLTAICISLLAMPFPGDLLSAYFLFGIFMRRFLWGMLYGYSESALVVIASHFLSLMLYLILLVGL